MACCRLRCGNLQHESALPHRPGVHTVCLAGVATRITVVAVLVSMVTTPIHAIRRHRDLKQSAIAARRPGFATHWMKATLSIVMLSSVMLYVLMCCVTSRLTRLRIKAVLTVADEAKALVTDWCSRVRFSARGLPLEVGIPKR
eukprot:1040701-Amphidinium_carterae.1